MNRRNFWEIFFGAALGIILYRLIIEIGNFTDNVASGFLLETMIIAAFGFAGILLVRRISQKLVSTPKQ